MNLIEKIKSTIYSEKLWFKLIISLGAYVALWAVFFGSLLLVPYEVLVKFISRFKDVGPYYVFGFFPLVSFVVPYFLTKLFKINKVLLYISHFIILVISILGFFMSLYWISIRYSNIFNLTNF